MLSRPPASFGCVNNCLAAGSGSRSARSVAAIASSVSFVNPSEHLCHGSCPHRGGSSAPSLEGGGKAATADPQLGALPHPVTSYRMAFT